MAICETLYMYLHIPLVNGCYLSSIVTHLSPWFGFGHASAVSVEALLDIDWVVLSLLDVTVVYQLIHFQEMALLIIQCGSSFISSISLFAWHSTVSFL